MSCRAGKKGGQIDCSRPFATGTCAYLSTHGADARSCVWWSDGAVVGDEATCANADVRRTACESSGLNLAHKSDEPTLVATPVDHRSIRSLELHQTITDDARLNDPVESRIYPEDPDLLFVTNRGGHAGGLTVFNLSNASSPVISHFLPNTKSWFSGAGVK